MPGNKPETKLDRCVEDVIAQGHDKDTAFAICTEAMKKSENGDLFLPVGSLSGLLGELKDLPATALGDPASIKNDEMSSEDAGDLTEEVEETLIELDEGLKKEWSQAFINDLPDDAFAIIEPGGKKDKEGLTVPRSLRHLPHHGSGGAIDSTHLRNALARLSETDISSALKKAALAHLRAHMRESEKMESDAPMQTEDKAKTPSLSHEQIRDKISAAFEKQAVAGGHMYSPFWIQATYPDHVIVMHHREGLHKVPYSFSKDNEVALGEHTPVEIQYVDRPTKGKIFIKKDKEGTVRWMSVSSTTDVDVDGQRFTEQSYVHSLEAASKAKDFGELRLEHHPFSRVGACDGQFLVREKAGEERVLLIETGTFDKTKRAKSVVRSLLGDEDGKYKISIGYRYDKKKLVDNVYTDGVEIFERSITAYPANVKTAIGVAGLLITEDEVKTMTDTRSIESILSLLGGDEEELKKILESGDKSLRALYDLLDVQFKTEKGSHVETNGTNAQENLPAAESARSAHSEDQKNAPGQVVDLPTEIEIIDENGNVLKAVRAVPPVSEAKKSLEDLLSEVLAEVKTLKGEVAALKTAGTLSSASPDAPRAAQYRIVRASRSEGTVVDENDPVARQAAASDRAGFFSQFPGGKSVKVAARPIEGG